MAYKTRRGPIVARVVVFIAISLIVIGLGMCASYCLGQAFFDLMLRIH